MSLFSDVWKMQFKFQVQDSVSKWYISTIKLCIIYPKIYNVFPKFATEYVDIKDLIK